MCTMSWVKYNTIDLYVYHRGAVRLVRKERDDAVGDTSALVYYREVLGSREVSNRPEGLETRRKSVEP